MAWKTVDIHEQRVRFVVTASERTLTFSSLCAGFGISSPTGYLWLAGGPDGILFLVLMYALLISIPFLQFTE